MTSQYFLDLKSLLLLNFSGERRRVLEMLGRGVPPAEVLGSLPPAAGWLKNFHPEKEVERCAKLGVRLLSWFDADYPSLLREIYDPPLVLYMKGSLEPSDQAALAIVGTRHPTFYGRTQAKRFARELAEAGLTLVSGFAKGIDQIAHEAALEVSYGRTIAVLGCGIDIEYPKGSRQLFERIAERGAVLSEYPLGTDPRAENFPKRNRIISGISRGVLVVEAAMRSGSLITAHQAAEQGREVFAIPGPVDQLTSHGAHKLLKEGAALAETPADVLEGLAISLSQFLPRVSSSTQHGARLPARLTEGGPVVGQGSAAFFEEPLPLPGRQSETTPEGKNGEAILKALAQGALDCEEITRQSSTGSAREVACELTRLELAGRIKKSPDGRFSLGK